MAMMRKVVGDRRVKAGKSVLARLDTESGNGYMFGTSKEGAYLVLQRAEESVCYTVLMVR